VRDHVCHDPPIIQLTQSRARWLERERPRELCPPPRARSRDADHERSSTTTSKTHDRMHGPRPSVASWQYRRPRGSLASDPLVAFSAGADAHRQSHRALALPLSPVMLQWRRADDGHMDRRRASADTHPGVGGLWLLSSSAKASPLARQLRQSLSFSFRPAGLGI